VLGAMDVYNFDFSMILMGFLTDADPFSTGANSVSTDGSRLIIGETEGGDQSFMIYDWNGTNLLESGSKQQINQDGGAPMFVWILFHFCLRWD
jgi:hypothetical protein